MRLSLQIAEGVRRRIGRHKDGRGPERRPIKINTATPHSFTLKQQLHKTGNKYYLCNRRKPPAARGALNPPEGLPILEKKHANVGRKRLKAILGDLVSKEPSRESVFILIYDLNSGVKCRFGGSVYGLKQRAGCFARAKNLFRHDRVSEWHPNDFPLSTRSAARHDGCAASPTPTLASLSRTHVQSQLQSPAFPHQQQRQQ